jgi:zinc transport system permease protein
VPHGDHVDYLHDGHRHAAHEGHYDEHSDDPHPPEGPAQDARHDHEVTR